MRVARARRVRAARGRPAVAANGALGISSRTCAALGNERRTATNAPPALMLSAVANSRKSFPFSSRLRTNTGIAKGRRVHFRRSFSGLRRIKGSSLSPAIYTFRVASNGPNTDRQPRTALLHPGSRRFCHETGLPAPDWPFLPDISVLLPTIPAPSS